MSNILQFSLLNGTELIELARDRRLFAERVDWLRQLGITDREIVAAMAAAPGVIDPLR
jgi:hypothetical protein